jgi:hypothetical protein
MSARIADRPRAVVALNGPARASLGNGARVHPPSGGHGGCARVRWLGARRRAGDRSDRLRLSEATCSQLVAGTAIHGQGTGMFSGTSITQLALCDPVGCDPIQGIGMAGRLAPGAPAVRR